MKYKVNRNQFLNWYFSTRSIESKLRRRLQRNKDGVATISVEELFMECHIVPSGITDHPVVNKCYDVKDCELIYK